ncbi:MAG: hypothetical protein M0R74_10655 [Dehalococcoidia bacterium]|jgi:hypothetical protein|nr:hypothetical protein [Dehalococcoidia bacterium]
MKIEVTGRLEKALVEMAEAHGLTVTEMGVWLLATKLFAPEDQEFVIHEADAKEQAHETR